MSRRIIAFAGRIGAGKTMAARYLTDVYGFAPTKFAGPLKAMLRGLGLDNLHLEGDLKEVPCDLLGGRTPRYAMQTLGTEWRDMMHPHLWTQAWARALPEQGRIVVDDLRFRHEAEASRRLGGLVVRIDRTAPDDLAHTHASEQLAFIPDCVLTNHGTPGDLFAALDNLLEEYRMTE